MIDRDELAAWLRLLETPGIGRDSARKLLSAFGSPEAVLRATASAHRGVAGAAVAQALAAPDKNVDALIAKTLAWLEAEPQVRTVIVLGDPAYPAALLETADPPLLLYAQGRLAALEPPEKRSRGMITTLKSGVRSNRCLLWGMLAVHLRGEGLSGGVDSSTWRVFRSVTMLDIQ